MPKHRKSSFWFTPKGLAAIGLIGAAVYFLLSEHRQHTWQLLPYLILLACPFMHFFMHGKHGAHGTDHQHEDNAEQDASSHRDHDESRETKHHK